MRRTVQWTIVLTVFLAGCARGRSAVQQGIPSASVEEGDQAQDPTFDANHYWDQWRRDRYHHPSDDMSQPLDLTAAVEYLRPMLLVGWDIANNPQRPTWKAGDFFGETFHIQASLKP